VWVSLDFRFPEQVYEAEFQINLIKENPLKRIFVVVCRFSLGRKKIKELSRGIMPGLSHNKGGFL